jgi:RNA polymerase sigma factor for flagellar operon FliA
MKVTNVISLDEFNESGAGEISESSTVSHFELPEEAVEKEELKVMLKEALDQLTDKERQVVLMYYYEDLTLKEISNVLEVSESRVSQLHTKALGKMRGKMGRYMGILTS